MPRVAEKNLFRRLSVNCVGTIFMQPQFAQQSNLMIRSVRLFGSNSSFAANRDYTRELMARNQATRCAELTREYLAELREYLTLREYEAKVLLVTHVPLRAPTHAGSIIETHDMLANVPAHLCASLAFWKKNKTMIKQW